MEALRVGRGIRRPGIVPALHETPLFEPGQQVRVLKRYPLGHYRVPLYLRGKTGVVEKLVLPAIDNEEEGFGRNAGVKKHYYRIAVPMTEIWAGYVGSQHDHLYIEVFEAWLEAVHDA